MQLYTRIINSTINKIKSENSILKNVEYFFRSTIAEKDGFYDITIISETTGYRVYKQGEKFDFTAIPNTLNTIDTVTINKVGTLKATVYQGEPVWVVDTSFNNVRMYNYEPEGLTKFPKEINMVDFNSKDVKVGDFLMLTGEILDNKKDIDIEMLGDNSTVLHLKIR